MIKLLHTADWHVGKTLRGRSRADEHREVLAEVAAIAREEEVDAVLVGGDLYDSAAPGPEAEEIVYAALLDLAATGAEVVVVSGNHDNPRRLEAVAPLLELGRVHVQTRFQAPAGGGVRHIETRSGERLAIALLPFLSQRHVIHAADLLGKDADAHNQTYADRISRVVALLCSDLDPGSVNVLLGHTTITNAVHGGGERLAHTVFDYSVAATVFPSSLHYVALGHLHRSQSLPAACPVRYCGSPLQLDFGEKEDAKSVLVVEASPGVPAQVREVPLRSGRPLRTIRATMAELESLAGTTGDAYLRIRVKEAPRVGLADEVRDIFSEAVDVMVDDPQRPESKTVESRVGKSPRELFAAYLEERAASDPQVLDLFDELMEEADAPAAS